MIATRFSQIGLSLVALLDQIMFRRIGLTDEATRPTVADKAFRGEL